MTPRHLIILVLFCLVPGRALALSIGTAGLVEKGNAAYEAGDFGKAMELYDQAAARERRPEISFNRGNALYRLGKEKEAAALWEEAAASSRNPDLVYAGRYNAGNALYRQGEAAAKTDPKAALDLFSQSADSYRAALAANPKGTEAGRNLELANSRIALLRQQLQQQQQGESSNKDNQNENGKGKESKQQQDGQDQQQDGERNSLQDLHDRQRQLRDESKNLADQQQQGQNDTGQAESQAQQQQDLRRQTENAAQQAEGRQKEDLEQATSEQQKAEEALKNNQPGVAAEHQQAAADKLAKAMAGEKGSDNKPQSPTPAAAEQRPQNDARTGQQTAAPPPDDSAQDILNAEKARQLLRQRMLRRGGAQVDKDW